MGEILNRDKDEPAMLETEKGEPEKEEGEKTLNGLLVRDVPETEKRRIEDLELSNSRELTEPTPYSDSWRIVKEKTCDIFREKLNNKLLIDLGGADGLMGKILQNEEGVAIKNYINVDKFYFKGWNRMRSKTQKGSFLFSEEGNTTNVSAGMLDFLQYVADSSVDVISINGINDEVIEDDDYHNELVGQIKRVLKQNGIVFGTSSQAISTLSHDSNFETKFEEKSDEEILVAILEKK